MTRDNSTYISQLTHFYTLLAQTQLIDSLLWDCSFIGHGFSADFLLGRCGSGLNYRSEASTSVRKTGDRGGDHRRVCCRNPPGGSVKGCAMFDEVHQGAQAPSATRATLFLRLNANADVRELAWNEFHARYAPIIGAFARRMGARSQDIADIVQDVVLGFFAVSPQFTYDSSRGRFRGYLKVCTWRVVRRKIRQTRNVNVSIDSIDHDELGVEAAWTDVWERERLQRAVRAVRERYSTRPDKARTFQAFELSTVLDLPLDQVARKLGMTVASVHQARTRINKAVKAALDDLDEDLG